MHFEQTELLNIAFEMDCAPSGSTVFLLHGWPDAPAGWKHVASRLQERGFRTVVPYLRGSYPTEFRSQATPRFEGAVAMAQDMIDLADKLGIERFAVVGHDWGARIAYTLATLFPERVQSIATLALAYQARGEFHLGSFVQSKQFWYQFFQCTDAVRRDPVGFARIQQDTHVSVYWRFPLRMMADRYGRRLPLMINIGIFAAAEILTGLATNYVMLLIVRALFGIVMGGNWGVGASLAMEGAPPGKRGMAFGLLQEVYAAGNVLAAVCYFFLFGRFGWRPLFFVGSLPAIALVLFIRFRVKESAVWQKQSKRSRHGANRVGTLCRTGNYFST